MGALKLIKDAYSIYVQSSKRFKSSASTILCIVEIISKSLVSKIKTENCQNKEGGFTQKIKRLYLDRL